VTTAGGHAPQAQVNPFFSANNHHDSVCSGPKGLDFEIQTQEAVR
jgi:hypothetical protein